MGKCDFNNRLSLRGADNINKVIAPSASARSSDIQVNENKLIRRPLEFFALQKIGVTVLKIGRSLDDCLRNRGITFDTVILGQQRVTRVSKDVKWTLGSSPRVTGERKSPRVTGEEERPWVTIGLIFLGSVSMATMARAECTPTPDCASIGYTESSCDGKFTRCPFDTSKLFCVPCDSSYKYNCIGDNITGGVGSTCGGKYASCTCADGYKWNGSACMVPDCNVGDIYYSDKSCSVDYDSSKTPIGVVVKKNELVMSPFVQRTWSSSSFADISKIINIDTIEDAYVEYNGIINTNAIVSAYNNDTADNNAGIYCNSYSPTGTNAGDWYLPAVGELYSYGHMNYSKLIKATNLLGWIYFDNSFFWSSSEGVGASAWGIHFTTGNINAGNHKKNSYTITCFYKIN